MYVIRNLTLSVYRASAAVGSVPQALSLVLASGVGGRAAQPLVRARRHRAPGISRAEGGASHAVLCAQHERCLPARDREAHARGAPLQRQLSERGTYDSYVFKN